MPTNAQKATQEEVCFASRAVTCLEEMAAENPQASYYRARYYDTVIGRFISEDPAEFEGSGPNLYAYAENEPIDASDPYGLKCITKIMVVTAYSDTGPGKDWPYFKNLGRGAGPGIVAVANTNPPPYPMGSTVSVSNNPDPFFNSQPVDPFNGSAYDGAVHDTGRGWNYPGHVPVAPDDWIDIWLPKPEAKKWGRQWRKVTICTPDDNGCKP